MNSLALSEPCLPRYVRGRLCSCGPVLLPQRRAPRFRPEATDPSAVGDRGGSRCARTFIVNSFRCKAIIQKDQLRTNLLSMAVTGHPTWQVVTGVEPAGARPYDCYCPLSSMLEGRGKLGLRGLTCDLPYPLPAQISARATSLASMHTRSVTSGRMHRVNEAQSTKPTQSLNHRVQSGMRFKPCPGKITTAQSASARTTTATHRRTQRSEAWSGLRSRAARKECSSTRSTISRRIPI